jgi:hypothetical protein
MLVVVRVVAFCDDVQACARTRYLGIGAESSHDSACLVSELAVFPHVIEAESDERAALGEAEGHRSTELIDLLLCLISVKAS